MVMRVSLRKDSANDELQIVYGEVYAPGVPDTQGDVMTAAEIAKTAYRFMQAGRLTKIDTNHARRDNGSYVVESFIAREGDPIFTPGAWVLGVKVPDKEWALVKSGELNGFSLDGIGWREERTVELEIPDELTGQTQPSRDHTHSFVVKFDANGNFLGGTTDEVMGHSHKIIRGTATEPNDGHAHRFSFVEGIGYAS